MSTGLASPITLAGGEFVMGSSDHYPEEAPAHPVQFATHVPLR